MREGYTREIGDGMVVMISNQLPSNLFQHWKVPLNLLICDRKVRLTQKSTFLAQNKEHIINYNHHNQGSYNYNNNKQDG